MISADAIRGYIDLMILSLLKNTPSYAYKIAQQISEVTGDEYAVKRLENSALVTSYPGTSESGKPRTYYQITEQGRGYLGAKVREWQHTRASLPRVPRTTRRSAA